MASSSKRSKVRNETASGKPELVTLKVTVGRETARKIRLEAFGRDVSLGQVLDELVSRSPQRFVLMDRAKGSDVPVVASSPTSPPTITAVGSRPSLGLLEVG